MSPLAIGMDVLLAALLAAALFVGARLNGRLAALKESQDGFARAVGELNAAAARADSALKALRAASEETHDALLDRIETARSLVGRLEQAAAAAERSKRRPEAGGAGRPASPQEAARGAGDDLLEPAPRPRASRAVAAAPLGSAAALEAGRDLKAAEPTARPPLRRTLSELLAARGRAGPEPLPPRAAPPAPSPPPSPRRRLLQDEDLFVDLDEGAADRSERRGGRT